MAEQDETAEPAKNPKRSLLLPISLMLGLMLGGSAFFAIYSGLILSPGDPYATQKKDEKVPKVVFVPIEPMIVSLGQTQLRFKAQLEVAPKYSKDVVHLMPRVLDILNGYLRALEISQLRDPAALIRIRAQMLRRVQLVTGDGHVRDLLITEFIFS